MLLQSVLTQRIIIILIVQVWPIFYGSYFGYKLLKRTKSRSTLTLSSFFFLISLTYFLATISIFFLDTPFAYFFYIFGIYFFVFSHSFFIIISWVLVKLDTKSPNWKYYLIITFYGVISTYVLIIGFFFNGIIYDASSNWIPAFTVVFLIFSWGILAVFLLMPQIYFSFKLYKIFGGIKLRRRINMFIVSAFLELTVVFSLFLYNTWVENEIFRLIYILLVPETSTIAAYLLYKSFGKKLE
ncbi:MAG: hypothetical protein HWN79_10445 [Candidatus Lokiarchaeota archaeon]|nr:hypothetical protein [Candidatus Lokiarchaeota archaeon]